MHEKEKHRLLTDFLGVGHTVAFNAEKYSN
jgi:hypothetical protein